MRDMRGWGYNVDKSVIKTYAIEARRKLIDAVRQKAFYISITEDGAMSADEAGRRLADNGVFLTPEQSTARRRLCDELAALSRGLDKKAAFRHIIENVACTWFNRLIALRIMEANGWLPSGVRVLSSQEPGRIEPDVMRDYERLDYVEQKKIMELRNDKTFGAAQRLYGYILTRQCNALSFTLPGMFERENDYTELLLPEPYAVNSLGVQHK